VVVQVQGAVRVSPLGVLGEVSVVGVERDADRVACDPVPFAVDLPRGAHIHEDWRAVYELGTLQDFVDQVHASFRSQEAAGGGVERHR
jgi:hypothetical protein